jgi:hypothetical protein
MERTASSVLVTTALGVSAAVALANTPTVGSFESTIPATFNIFSGGQNQSMEPLFASKKSTL